MGQREVCHCSVDLYVKARLSACRCDINATKSAGLIARDARKPYHCI